jgi:flagellar hook-associated protein 3 FlgL
LRITHAQTAQSVKEQLAQGAGRMQQAWRHVSSGRRVERPSDDPAATARILSYRSLLSGVEQRRFQVEAGHSLLTTVDTVLGSADLLLMEAQDLALNAGSPGVSEDDRRSMAEKVQGLIEQLEDIAETKYDNRALFAAGAANTSAVDLAGLDLSAQNVFATPLAALQDLYDELSAGDRVSDVTLAALKGGLDALVSYRTQVGVRVNRLESLTSRLLTMEHDLVDRKSGDEEVDLGQAMIDLKEEETAYQAALAASARLMRISLVDFL